MSGNGLFGSTTLDVVIGLIFVYLLLAIICTNVNEWIAGVFNLRARNLAGAIRQLLDKQPGAAGALEDGNWFLQQFYNHPLIVALCEPGKSKAHPAYISARIFATAVMDIATPQKPGPITFEDLQTGIDSLPPGEVKKSLLAVIQTAGNDIHQAQVNIQSWYEDTMQRVSGWYKKKTQLWTVIVASLLVLCANADTMQITKALWQDPTLRAQMVEQARHRTEAPQNAAGDSPNQNRFKPVTRDDVSELGGVVGWSHHETVHGFFPWADRLLGWLLSIVAVSLGAPFWFDLLNKFMRVRNGGDAPEEMPTAPQRPQPPAPAPATGKQ